ncbi:MAG: C4-type zinc ribbon domain-containing protein [Thermodesulfobacteriota bacterium]|nr:C4-type zinc ribbon domain-containing protein [Thermodesulfobacteriota bacterium]
MEGNISKLVELQVIDLDIRKFDQEMAEGYSELEKRKSVIYEQKAAIEQIARKIEAAEIQQNKLQTDLEDETARVKDRQSKVMNIQNNREYQCLMKEIEDGKRANKQREDEMIQLLELVESFKAKFDEQVTVNKAEEKLLAKEQGNIDKIAKDINSKKSSTVKARAQKAKDIEKKILKKYDMLLERREGVGIVGVTQGVCQGCHMNIPPQLFNDLLKEDKLYFCPTCNRIIYHLPEGGKG